MNQRVRQIILIGVAAVLLMGLFPPWTTVLRNSEGTIISATSEDYSFIFSPPYVYPTTASVVIDWQRLVLQFLVVMIATGGLVAAFYGGNNRNTPDEIKEKSTEVGAEDEALESSRPITHPWRRFFARQVDLVILSLIVGFVAVLVIPAFNLEDGGAVLLFSIYFLPLAILPFVEGALISSSNTPGKALLGLTVRKNGEKPTYEEAFNRALRVILYGLGLGIPLISAVTQVVAYRKLSQKGSTAWDEIGRLTVITR